jgi:hypothetical protein
MHCNGKPDAFSGLPVKEYLALLFHRQQNLWGIDSDLVISDAYHQTLRRADPIRFRRSTGLYRIISHVQVPTAIFREINLHAGE